ncbi:MAG: flagellar protein FlaG [Velocimicrobium sp.]
MKIESITRASGFAYEEKTSVAQKTDGESAQEVKKKEDIASLVRSGDSQKKQSKETEEEEDTFGQASERQIKNAVSQANKKIRRLENTSLEFSYHEPTKRVSIKVINNETKEVIREIPPEKSLDMLQKMWELAGILVDEKR